MTEFSAAAGNGWWLERARRFGGRLCISILNQLLGSGANFMLGLYLVRALNPLEFGLYGIGMAVILLYAGFGNALFLTQMVVHLPDKQDQTRTGYAASILALVGLFCAVTLMLAAGQYLHALAAGGSAPAINRLVMAVAAGSVANLLKNYFIRLAFSLRQEHKALAVNLTWAGALLLLLLAMRGGGLISDAAAALWLFAVANFMAAALGLIITRLPLGIVRWRRMRHDFTEASVGGRWAFGGVSVTWLQSQSYMYVTTLFVGPTGVALANAARMLVAPFSFLLPALAQFFLPHLAELRAADKGAMFRAGRFYTALLVGMGVLYLLGLWLCAGTLIPLFVGGRYPSEEILPLVVAWGCVLLFQLAQDGASLTMQALKAFRGLMLANAVSAAVTIATTLFLIATFGIPGAIIGVGVGEVLLAAFLWRHLRRERSRHDD